MWKKLWNDPVWSKVISAGIVGAVGAAGITYRQYWLSALLHGVSASWAYLFSTSLVTHWVLGLLALFTILFFILLISLSTTLTSGSKKNAYENMIRITPEWYDYSMDSFFGLKWRWTYDGPQIVLNAFCPSCDYQVFPDDPSEFSYGHIAFNCASCNRIIARIDDTWDGLKSKITRFIQQRIRNGTYPGAIKSGK